VTYIRLYQPEGWWIKKPAADEVVFGPIAWLQQSRNGTIALSRLYETVLDTQPAIASMTNPADHDIDIRPDIRGLYFYNDTFYARMGVFVADDPVEHAEQFSQDKSVLRDLIAGDPEGERFVMLDDSLSIPHSGVVRRFSADEAEKYDSRPVQWFRLTGGLKSPVPLGDTPLPLLPMFDAPVDQSVLMFRAGHSGGGPVVLCGTEVKDEKGAWRGSRGLHAPLGWLPHPTPWPIRAVPSS
jgi:hypothetical protein